MSVRLQIPGSVNRIIKSCLENAWDFEIRFAVTRLNLTCMTDKHRYDIGWIRSREEGVSHFSIEHAFLNNQFRHTLDEADLFIQSHPGNLHEGTEPWVEHVQKVAARVDAGIAQRGLF